MANTMPEQRGIEIPPALLLSEVQLREQWKKRLMDCFQNKDFAFQVKMMLWNASVTYERLTMGDLTTRYMRGELATSQTPDDNGPNLAEYRRSLDALDKRVAEFKTQCDRINFLIKMGLRSVVANTIFDLVDKGHILQTKQVADLVQQFEGISK